MNFYQQNMAEVFGFAQQSIIPELIAAKRMLGDLGMVELAHEFADQILAHSGIEEKMSCTKGCSFCCHDEILLTHAEANYILHRVKQLKVKPNTRRLLKQNKAEDYSKLKWADKRCSLLDDNGCCSIYQYRPLVCRTHNSIGDPELCNKSIHPGSFVPEGRTIESEAVSIALMLMEEIMDKSKLTSIHKVLKNLN